MSHPDVNSTFILLISSNSSKADTDESPEKATAAAQKTRKQKSEFFVFILNDFFSKAQPKFESSFSGKEKQTETQLIVLVFMFFIWFFSYQSN